MVNQTKNDPSAEIRDLYRRCAKAQADKERLDWIERTLNPDRHGWYIGYRIISARRHDDPMKDKNDLRAAIDLEIEARRTRESIKRHPAEVNQNP